MLKDIITVQPYSSSYYETTKLVMQQHPLQLQISILIILIISMTIKKDLELIENRIVKITIENFSIATKQITLSTSKNKVFDTIKYISNYL